MLTNVNSYSTAKCAWCLKVISWKHSFNRLNEENEIAKKKQQALDSLYAKGRISQSTHDSFNTEIAAAIAEIEKQQKDLIQKMTAKTAELHSQIKTLEILLANYEIQHVAGEIDETTYTLEINLLSNGLETAKHELETIQTAITQLCSPTIQEPTAAPAAIPTVEVAPMQLQEVIEVAVAAAPVEIAPAEVMAAPEPIIQEPIAAPIVEAPAAPIEQPAAVVQAEIIQAQPEPVVAEPAPVLEQPVVIEEPAAVIEAPVIEAPAPIVEAAPVVEAAPIIEAPAPVVEQLVVEAPTVEVPVEQPPVMEAAVVEQPAVETVAVAEAQETVVQEPVVVEEAKVEKPALDEFEVAEPDVVQKELLQAVEEIAENPFPAPLAARAEEIAEAPTEVSAETQPVPIHTAKESLPEISSSDSEHKE
jgi:hypothetical protein